MPSNVSSWVFPENKNNGFNDYRQAKDILFFYINYIGPYGYKKLANVQSKTIFGGMENASAIFYFENSVTGKQQDESLLAHEIVHQLGVFDGNGRSDRHLGRGHCRPPFTVCRLEPQVGVAGHVLDFQDIAFENPGRGGGCRIGTPADAGTKYEEECKKPFHGVPTASG